MSLILLLFIPLQLMACPEMASVLKTAEDMVVMEETKASTLLSLDRQIETFPTAQGEVKKVLQDLLTGIKKEEGNPFVLDQMVNKAKSDAKYREALNSPEFKKEAKEFLEKRGKVACN